MSDNELLAERISYPVTELDESVVFVFGNPGGSQA